MKSMNILKTVRYFLGILGILGAAALALACEQITEPPSGTEAPATSGRKLPAGSGGMGRVIISASTGSAASTESAAPAESAGSTESGVLPGITRTILPSHPQAFSRYTVVFSRDGYTDITIPNVQVMNGAEQSWELEAGPWEVKVSAFPPGGTEPAAKGNKVFTVMAGQITEVIVPIAPVPAAEAAGNGLFTYKVSFPGGVLGELKFGDVLTVLLNSGVEGSEVEGSFPIAPDDYDLSVTLSKGALNAGVWEKVHIYAGLESKAEFTFNNDDFAPTVYLAGTVTVTLLGEATIASGPIISVYSEPDYTNLIGTASVSDSPSGWIVGVDGLDVGGPLYFLAAVIDTDGNPYVGTMASGGTVGEAGTRGIVINAVDALAATKDYLNDASGGETLGDPVPLTLALPVTALDLEIYWKALLDVIAGKGKYVDLDLSACTMTENADGVMEFDPGTYNNGKNKIVSLVLPDAATSIKEGDYNNPTFHDFSAMDRVSGSKIISIGDYAFYNCAHLYWVDLRAAESIGNYAFSGCTNLQTITLGSTAPRLGRGMFFNTILVHHSPIIVRVHYGATGYDTIPTTYERLYEQTSNYTEIWANGFRGGGWDGSAFVSINDINNNIRLKIETFGP